MKPIPRDFWYLLVIALLVALIVSLSLQLHTSRLNELELSRKLYQAVRNQRIVVP